MVLAGSWERCWERCLSRGCQQGRAAACPTPARPAAAPLPPRPQVCRNEERGREAVERVRQDSGNPDVHLQVCDLASLASIRALAQSYLATGAPLDLLVNK